MQNFYKIVKFKEKFQKVLRVFLSIRGCKNDIKEKLDHFFASSKLEEFESDE